MSTTTLISSITIRRFKQLLDITVPLSQLTVLVGANNSGKSSVLQAVHFAVSLSQSAKLAGGVNWRNDQYELSLNPAQLLYTPIADVMALATGGRLAEAKAQQVETVFHSQDGQSCTVAISRGRNRNVAISITGRTLGEQLQDMSKPFSVYAPGLAGVPKEELFMSAGRVRRIVARGDANLVLRNVLWMLKRNNEQWQRFQEDISEIFPGVSIEVEFNAETDEYLNAGFSRDGGPMFPLDAAGTSLLQATQLLSYVALFEPRILVLDEPDSHLHPSNQRRFCRLIAELAEKRHFQIVMSTHSRHMLDALRKSSTLIWVNSGTAVENTDPHVASILLDLGALDSLDYFADGQLRYLVATEDQDTSILQNLLWSTGFSEEDTEVVSYSGCTKLEAATVLGAFIKSKAPNVVVIVHRDRDYAEDDEVSKYCEQLEQYGLFPFVTDDSDVEGYYLNSEHLASVNPELPGTTIELLIDRAVTDTREASIKSIVNHRTQAAFKRRRAGAQVDHGEIAVRAATEFESDPRKMVRGKEALNRLKSLLQTELKQNPRIVVPSQHLAIDRLRQILQSTS